MNTTLKNLTICWKFPEKRQYVSFPHLIVLKMLSAGKYGNKSRFQKDQCSMIQVVLSQRLSFVVKVF